MTAMKVQTLNVDFLQQTASVALFKQTQEGLATRFTNLNVNVPIAVMGSQSENDLKQGAIKAARQALKEALTFLETYNPDA